MVEVLPAVRGERRAAARRCISTFVGHSAPKLEQAATAANAPDLAVLTAYCPGIQSRPLRCAGPGLAADPHIGHLELGEGVSDLHGFVGRDRLDEGQQGTHRLDGEAHLARVALGFGAWLQSRAPHAQVDEHHDVVKDDVLDAQRR
jgi:hypothetical protein